MNLAQFVLLIALWSLSKVAFPATAKPDYFVTAGFDSSIGVVGAQSTYRLRLYQAVSFSQPVFIPPSIPFAESVPLASKTFEENRDGIRYRVLERAWAVFPFAAGEWTLSGGGVSGEAHGGAMQRVHLAAHPATLKVIGFAEHVPAAQRLAARQVTATETWREEATGEWVWTVRMEALGARASAIDLRIDTDEWFQILEKLPVTSEEVRGDVWVSKWQREFLVRPRRAGFSWWPERRIIWYDMAAANWKDVRLSGRKFHGAGSAQLFVLGPAGRMENPVWKWGTAASGILIFILSSAWWTKGRARRAVLSALRIGKAAAVRRAMMEWHESINESSKGIGLLSLAKQLPEDRAIVLRRLERAVFVANELASEQEWSSRELKDALRVSWNERLLDPAGRNWWKTSQPDCLEGGA